jgi:translation elongation factor aEF-1 beta
MSALPAVLKAPTNQVILMGIAIITLRIMPEDPDQDLKFIEAEAKKKISAFIGHGEERMKVEITPIAFGLQAVDIMFPSDEKLGGTEALEQEIATIKGVANCETHDVRRALG